MYFQDFPTIFPTNPIFFQDFPWFSKIFQDFLRFSKIFPRFSKIFPSSFSFICWTPRHRTLPIGQVRPFDAKADGTVFGDAVAALVLRRHEDAWWWYHSIYIYIIYTIYMIIYVPYIYMYAGLHIMLYIYLWLCYMYIYIYIYLWLYIYICIIIYYDLSYIYIYAVMIYDIHDYIWYMDLIEHEAFYRVKSPCLSGCRKGRRGEWPGVCRPEGLRGETLGKHWSQGCSSSTSRILGSFFGIPSGNVTVCYGKSP